MSGKGSKPRPFSVPQEQFAKNWDMIFNRDKQNPSTKEESIDEKKEKDKDSE